MYIIIYALERSCPVYWHYHNFITKIGESIHGKKNFTDRLETSPSISEEFWQDNNSWKQNGRTKTSIPNWFITLIKYNFFYILIVYLIGLDIFWESFNDNPGCNWSFEMLFRQGFLQMIQACFWNNFNYTLSDAQHMTISVWSFR